MRQAGCDTVVPAEDLAVVGITEILSHLPKIYSRFHHLIKTAESRRPDVAVVIDSPAFNWRVAREMRRLGVPVVYYVCPQFWAWRQGRVRLLQRYVTQALVIFPFEEQFYRERGVETTFVGHPLAALSVPTSSRDAYAAEHRVDAGKEWVTIMPGSREKEVSRNLPTILDAVRLAGWSHEYLSAGRQHLEAQLPGIILEASVAGAVGAGRPCCARPLPCGRHCVWHSHG